MKVGRDIRHRWICVALLVFLSVIYLHAHDFWLASSPWSASPGATITVTANVGDDTFPVSDSFTKPERVEFVRVVGTKTENINPQFRRVDNSLAAEIVLPPVPATYIVVMSVKGHFLSMPPKQFESYLKEEGLNDLVAERARRGEATQPSRERYWRQAKLLVHAGNGGGTHLVGRTGLVAELVPDRDLTQLRPNDLFGVRLVYQGRPLSNAQVVLTSSSITPKAVRATRLRTDSEGRAHFKLVEKGPYLLTSVVMVRREGETGPEAADWESYWCSLTFNVPEELTK